MISCEKGYEGVCGLLLTQKLLNTEARDKTLGTALDWACEFEQVQICKMLLENSFREQTPQSKARLLHRACLNNNQKLQSVFIETWKEWNAVDSNGNTVFHIACLEGYKDVIDMLLQNFPPYLLGGYELNQAGKTPYQCAVSRGQLDILALLGNYQLNR